MKIVQIFSKKREFAADQQREERYSFSFVLGFSYIMFEAKLMEKRFSLTTKARGFIADMAVLVPLA